MTTPDPDAAPAPDAPLPEERILSAWEADAPAWLQALESGTIRSRRVTDAALVDIIRQVPTGPILDVGCGEGWLVRELASHRLRVTGMDGSPTLVRRAEERGGGEILLLTYAEAVRNPRRFQGPYGTIVFNFSLFEEKITPILEAVGSVLFPYGRILIQTLHPVVASGTQPYRDGWREETFDTFGVPFPEPMPWYFRTVSTWIAELRRAGLILMETYEPLDPDTGRPLSLILNVTIPERRKRPA